MLYRNIIKQFLWLAVYVNFSLFFCTTSHAASYVFGSYSDISSSDDKIRRFNLDGSGGIDIIASSGDNRHDGLTVYNNQLYYVERNATTGIALIKKANFDGTGVTTIYNLGTTQVQGLTIIPSLSKIYFSSLSDGNVQSINLDGSGSPTVVPNTSTTQPIGVLYDSLSDKVYFGSTNQTGGPNIYRINPDGTGKETLNEKAYTTFGFAIDNLNDKLYWTQGNSYLNPEEQDSVFRANLSDFPISSATIEQFDIGDVYPTNTKEERLLTGIGSLQIAIDPYGGKLYLANQSGTRDFIIANLDGSGSAVFYDPGTAPSFSSYYPLGIALALDNTRAGLANGLDIHLGNGVIINFSEITGDGNTFIAADPGSEGSFLSDAQVQAMLPGSIYEISTDATVNFGAGFDVTLTYSQAEFDALFAPLSYSENSLQLFHYTGSGVEVGQILSLDTVNNRITAHFTSTGLSPFGVGVMSPEPMTVILLTFGLFGLIPKLRNAFK